MSLRLEMLQVARLAEPLLGDSVALVRRFLSRQRNDDGGFADRTGKSDLYYTVFGLDSLLSLRSDIDWRLTEHYLMGFGSGENLDFVHLCCLIRGWSVVAHVNPSAPIPPSVRQLALDRLSSHRTPDGGFHPVAGNSAGTAYAAFLAVGAYQDLKEPIPEPMALVQSFKWLETRDGAWTNERLPLAAGSRAMDMGSTNATAAAVAVLRQLRMPINRDVGQWLLDRVHSSGGFLAMPMAPIPDLLSTATALHALSGLERSTDGIQERCLDYIDTLWTNEGSFHGNWTEDTLDTEYTFYGLLALGHLAV
ncbi:MAG: hypothetical protein JNN07_27935 [Verrucomicrobiales bacterium]|nr:hypothetical protein [Verrucomicrobiales bacterium]